MGANAVFSHAALQQAILHPSKGDIFNGIPVPDGLLKLYWLNTLCP